MRYILSSKGSIECAVIATWEITFINALNPIGTVAIGLYIVSLLYIEKIKQLTPLNFNILGNINYIFNTIMLPGINKRYISPRKFKDIRLNED